MGRFSEFADVPSPVEATFAYITDQDRLAEWNDHVPRVTMTADVRARGLRWLLAPVVTSEMRKSTVAALAALRARLDVA